MGSFADKLSFEERWEVIHYIRSLQAKSTGATYNQDENTLNTAYGTPGSQVEEAHHHADDAGGEAHGEDSSHH